MRPPATPLRRRAAFTLLEVVLAMGLLVLGMSALLGLFSFGAAVSRSSSLRGEAAGAIDAVVAELEETLFPLQEDGSAGPPREIEGRPVRGHPGVVYGARARPNPASAGPSGEPLAYLVEITLSWSSQGARRSRAFTALFLREVPFGERLRRRSAAPAPTTAPAPAQTLSRDP